MYLFTPTKKNIAACKICLNSEIYSPTIPRIYPFLMSIFSIRIKTCIALDKNNKIHLLISSDAETIIHNKTQFATDDVLRWYLESKNKHCSKSSDRRKNYNVKEYCINNIDQRLRLPIAKVLDPLAEWVKDTSKHYLTKLQCLNKDYLTLFLTSWISTIVMDEYI